MKVVIVGGVAGGASAAARLRRLDENAEIILLERGAYISFANCGLPYYVGGAITKKSALTLQTPESFRTRFGIDVRVNSEVTAVHPAEKTVEVRTADGTYTESYDKLILSPGAEPVQPPLPACRTAACSRCAPSRTPCASATMWMRNSRTAPSSSAAGTSAWRWPRT